MGRGLSKLQKDILGVAYHANRLTQKGTPKVKTGEFRHSCLYHDGAGDLHHALASVVIYQLELTERDQVAGTWWPPKPAGAISTNNAQAKRAKASVVRAMTRLRERGLIMWGDCNDSKYRWGYVLTPDGFEIGADNEVRFPDWLVWKCGLFRFGFSSQDQRFFDVCGWLKSGQLSLRRLIEIWDDSGTDKGRCWNYAAQPVYSLIVTAVEQSDSDNCFDIVGGEAVKSVA